MWLLLAGTVLLTACFWGSQSTVDRVDRRAVIVGLGVPAVALTTNLALVSSLAGTPALQFSWRALVAVAVVAAMVLGAALWLPGATGVVLIVGLAIATVNAQPEFVTDRRWIVVALLLVAPGLYLGWRWRRQLSGVAPDSAFDCSSVSGVDARRGRWLEFIVACVASFEQAKRGVAINAIMMHRLQHGVSG